MVHSALERGTVDEVSLATARYDFMRGAVDAADVVRAATEHVSPRTPLPGVLTACWAPSVAQTA